MHSFLLIGQSNMAGRGFQRDVAPIYNENIKVLKNGKWQTMWEPIHNDRPNAGIGPSASFAATWCLKNPEETIGLIPSAEGGSSLDDWSIDGLLFEHAILQAKLAQKTSKIAGILWHQGESDCFPDKVKNYKENFSLIIATLREELNILHIPIIIGGLGDYLTKGMYGQYFSLYQEINNELKSFANAHADCFYVTAAGLTSNPDGIHIDAISQRLFGIRYFEAFLRKESIFTAPENEENILKMINERPFTQTEKIELLNIEFSKGNLELEDYQKKLSLLKQNTN
ncbi:sialate O-acetylesterase [Arachidicoccus soli]|uniref:Sialate O-acetylesterase n=1 Tax=Arachidicoccus soli TaxID=2341117 RepID=A0A386HM60_9BACT|nr:sialate O-acetylesterase [Arachidicoccus soli]AYD46581.1 sialate O-acetylesterase [Arachidicoccus soli]